nr:hypothetical protein [Tanacetum cinerariifolium]
DKHAMCVLKSVAKPLKQKSVSESKKKPRNNVRKLYERFGKIYKWSYIKFTPSGYMWKPKSPTGNVNPNLIEIVLFIVDSGCSKHMTGNLKLLINFMEKFLGTFKFGNDQIAPILGYGDLVQRAIGNVTISRVYFVEGLGHNLFSVGQFCDSDLEVAFCQRTCFIRNLDGVDLLTGSRGNNLYTLSLQDMMESSPIYLLSKASKTKSWLWHRRLSHLNFGAINHLARDGLVRGQFCDSDLEVAFRQHTCFTRNLDGVHLLTGSQGNNLYTLSLQDMMSSSPICLLSKASKTKSWLWHRHLSHLNFGAINNLARQGLVRLKVSVRRIRTDNGTEFVNQTLHDYYEEVGISNETSVARFPQQNRVVKRRNRTLIEAARTMLIYAQAPLFLWAEAVATACFTQNRSIIHLRHGKTPYELLHNVEDDNLDMKVAHMRNDPLFGVHIPEVTSAQSSSTTYKEALTQSCWIEAMQEELNDH